MTKKEWFLNVYHNERNFGKMFPLDTKGVADSPNNFPTVLKQGIYQSVGMRFRSGKVTGDGL